MSNVRSNSRLVEMAGIYKTFANVRAVVDGHFDLYSGEIHSLIGENGAGKSTLMKILYGIHRPDEGEIRVRGRSFAYLTPATAISLDIGMVHQEFMLVKEMTVLENIILGFEPRRGQRIDFADARRRIRHFVDTYGLEIEQGRLARDVSVGEAQRVEIIKALYRGANILILDEPTSVLTPQETEKLFEILDLMRKGGQSIVFISHKLREVMSISDRITVMRRGRHITTVNKANTSIPDLARLMVGRDVFLTPPKGERHGGREEVLSMEKIYVPGEKELSKLRGVSLVVHAGEILGLAGVDGNGQSELVEAIAGLRPVERGRILLMGSPVQNKKTLKIRKTGLAYIPEDRNAQGVNLFLTVKENLIGDSFRRRPFSSWGVIRQRAVFSFVRKLIERFDIRPPVIDAAAASLSGGNAQKVVVAREISEEAPFLLASQPTRGVDIGAVESIHQELVAAREKGAAVLLVSADLEEILSLSDRIVVMYEGRITGELSVSEANEEKLGLLMTGATTNV